MYWVLRQWLCSNQTVSVETRGMFRYEKKIQENMNLFRNPQSLLQNVKYLDVDFSYC